MTSSVGGWTSGAPGSGEGMDASGRGTPKIQATEKVTMAKSPTPISPAVGWRDAIIAANARNAEAAPKARVPEKLDRMEDGCHPSPSDR